jgi:hypothetical protein
MVQLIQNTGRRSLLIDTRRRVCECPISGHCHSLYICPARAPRNFKWQCARSGDARKAAGNTHCRRGYRLLLLLARSGTRHLRRSELRFLLSKLRIWLTARRCGNYRALLTLQSHALVAELDRVRLRWKLEDREFSAAADLRARHHFCGFFSTTAETTLLLISNSGLARHHSGGWRQLSGNPVSQELAVGSRDLAGPALLVNSLCPR